MFTYIGLGLLAVSVLFILANVLIGLIRGIKKTIGSLVAIIVSAILAAIITSIICNPSSSLVVSVMQMLEDMLAAGAIKDVFAIEEIGEAISHYAAMIAAPFIFLALYIVLSIIVGIVVSIVIKFIPPKEKPAALIHRLGGVGVGFVCGLLVSLLILMPIVGVLDIVVSVSKSEAVTTFDESGEIPKMFEGAEDNGIYKFYSATTGWMFDSFASSSYNGERIYLKKDIEVILAVVGNLGAIAGDATSFGQEQIDALNAIIDNLDRSVMVKHTLAGVLSEMATKWSQGETFMGMESIDAGQLLNPVLNRLFGVLSTSDETNISSDMRTLTAILEVFVKYDLLSDSENYDNMLEKFAGDGVIAELISVANSNARMSVLADEITQLSIRALASTIGIPETPDDRYNQLMDSIADTLNESYFMSYLERVEFVEDEVADALDEYGVEVDGQAAKDIAVSILADLGDVTSLEGSDIREFFVIYAIANGNAGSTASIPGYAFLSNTSYDIVVNPDGTISVGEIVFENYNYVNYSSSQAYLMGKRHVDIGDAATLYSADAMKSSLITFADILANVKKYSDCADPEAEARKISDLLATAIDIFKTDDGGEVSKNKIIEEVGVLLDKMSETEIFGADVTADLLKGIFQTKTVREDLGLTIGEVNNFADKMNETAKGEDSSYSQTTQVVSSTVTVIEKLSDNSTTKEERKESTKELLNDMTPANAELMGSMTTPSMMVQYGAIEEKAETVSASVSTLFSNMADFTPDTDSEEGQARYDAEAEAVNAVLQLAMDSADSDANALFNSEEGGEGRTGSTAEEFVDLLVNSEVVGQTLITTVYEDGNTENPYGVIPTEEDKAVLNDELLKYYEANKDNGDEQLMLKLNAVAIISGMEPIFDVEY